MQRDLRLEFVEIARQTQTVITCSSSLQSNVINCSNTKHIFPFVNCSLLFNIRGMHCIARIKTVSGYGDWPAIFKDLSIIEFQVRGLIMELSQFFFGYECLTS